MVFPTPPFPLTAIFNEALLFVWRSKWQNVKLCKESADPTRETTWQTKPGNKEIACKKEQLSLLFKIEVMIVTEGEENEDQ